jgi:hypothetical protein
VATSAARSPRSSLRKDSPFSPQAKQRQARAAGEGDRRGGAKSTRACSMRARRKKSSPSSAMRTSVQRWRSASSISVPTSIFRFWTPSNACSARFGNWPAAHASLLGVKRRSWCARQGQHLLHRRDRVLARRHRLCGFRQREIPAAAAMVIVCHVSYDEQNRIQAKIASKRMHSYYLMTCKMKVIR